METTWYIRKTRCRNGVEERTKFPVRSDHTKGRAARREAKRGARRADNAERQVARLLNNNFSAGADRHIVLEYTDEAMKRLSEKAETETHDAQACPRENMDVTDRMYAEAQKDLELFIRRIRREAKKNGIELKYLAVTSDMDGKKGTPARLHHHLIINTEAAALCERKWRGTVWEGELYNVNGDLSALAAYLIAQTRAVAGTQCYKPSRTLEQPEISEPIPLVGNAAKYAENELSLPRDCILLYRSTYARGATQYIRYIRKEKGAGGNGTGL